VTGRRVAGLVLSLVAVAAGVFLALAGADILRWRGQIEQADVRFAAARGATWEPDTILPGRVSRELAGVEDDIAYRDAVASYRRANPFLPARTLADVTRKSEAEIALSRASREDPSPERRSRLANLRGVLALEEGRRDEAQAPLFLRRSATEFREAVRLDGANVGAKANLELALQLLRQAEQGGGGGSGGRRGDPQASGAGTASSGSGY
jgi:hypothetical protein